MARSLFLAVGLLSSLAQSQTQTYDVFYGGTKSGETISEISKDGTVSSKMNLKIGPVTITSSLSGTIKDGMLVDCVTETTQSGTTTKVIWKDNKCTVFSGGKELVKDRAYKATTKASFSVFHPILNSLLWNSFQGTAKKGKALFVDSLAELEPEFKSKTATAKGPEGSLHTETWSADLGPTPISIVFSKEGKSLGIDIPSQKLSWVLQGYSGLFVDPLARYRELSQPTFQVVTERRIRMKTRDGVILMADISRPKASGKFPTILIRTPYGRAASLSGEEWYAKRGYVVMSQDVRGRGGSDGEWDPLVYERKDGKDTLDWIVTQPWSDGKVGMIGGSYLGYVQWAAASTNHPALKCIIPQVSPPQPDSNFPWDHGSFMLLGDLWWCRIVKDRASSTEGAFAKLTNLEALKTLPLTQVDNKFFGSNIEFFDKWVKRQNLADWGDVFTTEDVAKVKIPAMHVSGIWDGDGIGTAIHWAARNNPKDKLIFGPWTHLFNTSHKFGDQEYGDHGILELESNYLRFFDTYLKGKTVNLDQMPNARFFVTGSNRWLETSHWPAPQSKPMSWYLQSGRKGGKLQTTTGNGSDSYAYKPNKPAIELSEIDINITGESTVMPLPTHRKNGVTYSSPVLENAKTFAGPLKAELYVSTSGRDATFHVAVLDQDEKGVARLIGMPGTQRATYVDGKMTKLRPGQVVKITIEPWWFAHEFKKGHRFVIVVTSDSYPKFARNPGTGEPDWSATKLMNTTQTIWMNKKYPSQIRLWEIPN